MNIISASTLLAWKFGTMAECDCEANIY
jgi:hypothetical protein